MNGLRDNEVLLQAGYDIIVISLPAVASRCFTFLLKTEHFALFDRDIDTTKTANIKNENCPYM